MTGLHAGARLARTPRIVSNGGASPGSADEGHLCATVISEAEAAAVQADAERRLPELLATRRRLARDADDARVMSELTTVESEIRSALGVIG